MGSDTILRSLMHLVSTDLHLKGLPGTSDQRRMKGLVHVRLRHCDIVLETSGNRLIHRMDHTQSRVTVLHRIDNNTNCKQIVDLVQRLVLVLHLLVDAEEMLDPAVHLRFDLRILDNTADLIHDSLNILLSGALAHGYLLHQAVIFVRLQIF